MSHRQGYWSGMPTGMKGRLAAWLVYFLIALGVFTQTPIFGTFLLVLPVLWNILLLWLSGETGYGFGPFSGRKNTVLGYTVRYLWDANVYTRAALTILSFAIVLGGLGWIATENLRDEAAKPTLTERVAGVAESATEATKEKTSGWISTAKGWFGAGDDGE